MRKRRRRIAADWIEKNFSESYFRKLRMVVRMAHASNARVISARGNQYRASLRVAHGMVYDMNIYER